MKETPVSALVDGDGGLGHVPAHFAMQVAIDKAKQSGMAIAAVRNSAHFGATGYYTLMAAKAGADRHGVHQRLRHPGGADLRQGSEARHRSVVVRRAERATGNPFLLDMATTTVAAGRIRNKANEGLRCPPGWVLNKDGLPSTDPLEAREKGGFLTSLGGSPENSSYKGYGLAVMVNILASCLSGATLITDPMHTKKPQGNDIGHCFIAIDPGLFRDPERIRRRRGAVLRRSAGDQAGRSGAAGDGRGRSAMEQRREADGGGDPGRSRPAAARCARSRRPPRRRGCWISRLIRCFDRTQPC